MTSNDLELKVARALLQSYADRDDMSDEEWEAYDDKDVFLRMARAAIKTIAENDPTR
jgi:hypothetical protein